MTYTNSYQSLTDIHKIHPNEWVLLANPSYTDGKIEGGVILFHSENKKDLIKVKLDLQQFELTTWVYTGSFPQDKRLWLGIHRQVKSE